MRSIILGLSILFSSNVFAQKEQLVCHLIEEQGSVLVEADYSKDKVYHMQLKLRDGNKYYEHFDVVNILPESNASAKMLKEGNYYRTMSSSGFRVDYDKRYDRGIVVLDVNAKGTVLEKPRPINCIIRKVNKI